MTLITDSIKQAVNTLCQFYEAQENADVGVPSRRAWTSFENKAIEFSKKHKKLIKYFGKDHKEVAEAVQICIDARKIMERGRGR